MHRHIQQQRTNGQVMSSVAFNDEGRDIIARLERREVRRTGNVALARRALASKIGAMPGTLENLARGRLKSLDGFIRRRAEQLLLKEIEREIAALTHELASLRQSGADPRLSTVAEVESALEEARKLMGRPV